ncbi:hypothetical protein predicted by Glimmer/Critica [Acetobacter senegalensis]|uniref:Uncharacterized protein n=2 Tax=Acetobacter TaxID=434 RepID=A0A0U5B748_9PROT|nr:MULTISPECIES: hypothetical protein [Acetobacter]OUI83769.1 hypothetical protein HC62_13705 [Acetobacter tropicalis]CEF40373.1 hypothetical protein predicted by Glimmer/Critica [Acetobacter senegalensis]
MQAARNSRFAAAEAGLAFMLPQAAWSQHPVWLRSGSASHRGPALPLAAGLMEGVSPSCPFA